jgi:hypothetical protein
LGVAHYSYVGQLLAKMADYLRYMEKEKSRIKPETVRSLFPLVMMKEGKIFDYYGGKKISNYYGEYGLPPAFGDLFDARWSPADVGMVIEELRKLHTSHYQFRYESADLPDDSRVGFWKAVSTAKEEALKKVTVTATERRAANERFAEAIARLLLTQGYPRDKRLVTSVQTPSFWTEVISQKKKRPPTFWKNHELILSKEKGWGE